MDGKAQPESSYLFMKTKMAGELQPILEKRKSLAACAIVTPIISTGIASLKIISM